MDYHKYQELVEAALDIGARRPLWRGDEPIAQWWADCAERLIAIAREVKRLREAIAECDHYSGHAMRRN